MFRIVASYEWSSTTARALGRLLAWLGEELEPGACFVSSWETVMVPQETLGPVGVTLPIDGVRAFLAPAEFHFEWLVILYPRPPVEVVREGSEVTVDGETRLWAVPPRPLYETSRLEVYVWDMCDLIVLGRDVELGRRLAAFLAAGDPAPALETVFSTEP